MAVTQAQIDEINVAIAGTEKIVQLAGKHVEYRSVDQLIKSRDELQRQLDAQNAVRRPRLVYHTHGGRGL